MEASDRSRSGLFHPTGESAAVRSPSIIPYCLPGEDLLRATARVRRQGPSMGLSHPTASSDLATARVRRQGPSMGLSHPTMRVPDPLSIVPFHLPMKASLLAMAQMRNRFPSMGLSHPTMRGANQAMILHPSIVRHQLRADLRLARVREHLSCLRMTGSVHLTKVKEPHSGVRFRFLHQDRPPQPPRPPY